MGAVVIGSRAAKMAVSTANQPGTKRLAGRDLLPEVTPSSAAWQGFPRGEFLLAHAFVKKVAQMAKSG